MAIAYLCWMGAIVIASMSFAEWAGRPRKRSKPPRTRRQKITRAAVWLIVIALTARYLQVNVL